MQKDTNNEPSNGNNILLCAGIFEILRNDWSNRIGQFDGYWFGYEALSDELKEKGIFANLNEIKKAMKQLSNQHKVELRHTFNDDWKINGRGWFACT